MRYLPIILIFLVSCNPCKYVAKHPECFPADTVKIVNDVVRYEKEIIRNDSIIYDTIPCDPITKTYYKTKTVWKTKEVLRIDTIYQYKDVAKINPLNISIKNENDKLINKVKNRNKAILIISGIMILLAIVIYAKYI